MFTPIHQEDFDYELAAEKIAVFPLAQRDASKLLIYDGQIRHEIFRNIAQFLEKEFTLFFNNTKVIPARLFFRKNTGALIEVFLLNPIFPQEIALVMACQKTCRWAVAVGNLKRLKENDVLVRESEILGEKVVFKAILAKKENPEIVFEWNSEHSFADIIAHFGQMPLPPYLKREVAESDKATYQTVYSQKEGAVAAPTAGLHFTEIVLAQIQDKGIKTDFLTLHVAGGTFQPIRHENVWEHPMHSEQIVISQQNLETILAAKKIAAVGTTSMRTLESLYWYGVALLENPEAKFLVEKLDPYKKRDLPEPKTAIRAILEMMKAKNWQEINGETEIMIVPNYDFKLCEALITNFHLPATTLIMLVAAFVGQDWRKIYETALQNDYRFLSFGDSSLLFRKKD